MPHPGITTRSARRSDLSWCVAHDGHLGEQALRAKIDRGELFLAEVDGEPAGLLRVDSLWSSVTLIAQVRVLERHRRLGVGRALVDHVAAQVRGNPAPVLLSSTAADEPDPQAWHRALGFVECGFLAGFPFPDGIGEIFFARPLPPG